MRTLTLTTGNFDRTNTFNLNVGRPGMRRCGLHQDYLKTGDGVLWIMQYAACIASSYTKEEVAERLRLNTSTPVVNGEIVLVDGKTYKVRVLGDYSDAAILDPVRMCAACGSDYPMDRSCGCQDNGCQ